MATKPKIRQTDIAREAGVSVATVDRVLNARPGVKEHTAQRIREAIDRLGEGAIVHGMTRRNFRFDFILPANPNIFISMLEEATHRSGKAMAGDGVTIQCHRVEGFNPDVLAAAVRDIGATSHGLCIMALENPTVREAVNDVVDSGVPIVTIVSNLATSRVTGYVGLNNRAAGRTIGYLMGRFLPDTPTRVALFEGSLDLAYRDHQEREIGFRDALREQFPHIELMGRWQTQDDSEIAYRLTENLLDEHPDVAGIYCVGGGLRGIGEALRNAGRSREVVLIGHELTRYSRPLLIDGTVDAVIDQNPGYEVQQAAQMLLDYQTGKGQLRDLMPRVEVYFRENLP